MESNFPTIRFGDALTPEGTRNGVYKGKEFHGRGQKIINMGELFGNPRLFDIPMKRVELDAKEQKRFLVQPGDLLFARRSLVAEGAGKCCLIKEVGDETCFESSIIKATPRKDIADSEYIFYLFTSQIGRHLLGTILRQTAVSGITGTDLVELEIPFPALPEQKAIAHILGTLDDKIELNRKTNETLETMAKALFKSWFVDFDPVRAKAEGRPTGLPAEISDLFPDSFEDSELGEIPRGWSVTEVGDCSFEIESGKRPKGGINKGLDSGVPSVGAESIDVAGSFDFGKTKYVSNEFASSVTKGWVRELDVALYKDGGKPGEFKPRVAIYGSDFPFPRFMVNEHVFLLRSVELGQSFLYHLFSFDFVREQIIHMGSSKGAQPGLNQQEVKSSVFVKPSESILRVFAESMEAPTERQFHLGKQNLLLEQLRDALLPRLISGELRIPDAEKMLEEAGI